MPGEDPAARERAGEASLLEQARRLRALHGIISRPDLSVAQQIDATLRLGCELLGAELGMVSRHDPDADVAELLHTVATGTLRPRRGTRLPLAQALSPEHADAVAIGDLRGSAWRDHPAVTSFGLQAYIGCRLHVHGRRFGTVDFVSREPAPRPFTEADEDLVKLMGSWISVMMERGIEAEALRRSKEEADAANLAKTAFLASMSHEIRTPLHAILGFAEIALDDDQTDAQRIAALHTIRRSGDHLLHLIDGILDFSRIEAGALDLELGDVELPGLVADVVAMVRGAADAKGLPIEVVWAVPVPSRLRTDRLRLRQVLLNLVSNAVKFTEAGRVEVVVRFTPGDRVVAFEVRDTGIGMQPEHLDRVFEPFRQAESSTFRRFGGTGLGLALSRSLAGRLGGTLSAHSTPGVGSTFTLRLPGAVPAGTPLLRSDADPALRPPPAAGSDPLAPLRGRVLVADDDLLNQVLLTRFLETMGLEVEVASSGRQAVDMLHTGRFDLALVDMQMPMMSGEDALRALRAEGYAGPVAILTANATGEDRERCEAAGADAFLTKPISRQRLHAACARFLPAATPG